MSESWEQNRNEAPLNIQHQAIYKFLLLGICISFTAVAGYLVGTRRVNSDSILPVQQRVPFEFYLNEHSFSEIENTKSTLEALCSQFLTELRLRHEASAVGLAPGDYPSNPLYQVDVPGAIQELEEGIEQLKGTGQASYLVRDLLMLLKRENQYDRWLDVYLAALYEHPTQRLVSSYARDAERISRLTGREYDLAKAFDLLRHIPSEFHSRDQTHAPGNVESAGTVKGTFNRRTGHSG